MHACIHTYIRTRKKASPSRLAATHFDHKDGMLRIRGSDIPRDHCVRADADSSGLNDVVVKSLFWAAGFSFSFGRMVLEVLDSFVCACKHMYALVHVYIP
jgi:hypothetical protein